MVATLPTAGNTATDWRSRAQPVVATTDWRSRAQPTAAATTDWRSRAQPAAIPEQPVAPIQPLPETPGNDMGKFGAGVLGFNSAIPFGERIVAGLGAAGAKAYDSTIGDNLFEGKSVSDLYKQARQDQAKTAEKHSVAHALGAGAGLVTSLPLLGTKVLAGGSVAADAGIGAKALNTAKNIGKSVAVAAPVGAVSAYGASRSDLDSKAALEDAKIGGIISAGLGAAAPVVGAAVGGITKPNVSGAVKRLAGVAKNKFGIDLSMDQVAPSALRNTTQKVSQNIPGSGVDAFREKQTSQWMRGVAGTLGESGDNLGPETINLYLKRASEDFSKPLASKYIKFTPEDIGRIVAVPQTANGEINNSLVSIVKNNADEILKNIGAAKTGHTDELIIPGEKLASLRSQLVKKLPDIEGGARSHVADLVDQLDTVIERHLSAEELTQLSNARRQWRNFRTLEPLLEKSTDGTINPTQLMQRVANNKFITANRVPTGEDDLIDLARIGKQFMAKKGGSDTAEKTAFIHALKRVADIGAIGTGAMTSLPATTAVIGGNKLYQMLINQSPAVVKKLVNDAPKTSKAAVVAGMLGSRVPAGVNKKSSLEKN